eukprot:16379-Pelagococcus_subviridis.AAC.2
MPRRWHVGRSASKSSHVQSCLSAWVSVRQSGSTNRKGAVVTFTSSVLSTMKAPVFARETEGYNEDASNVTGEYEKSPPFASIGLK